MKLLIADDEQKIRTGMASLDWDSIGITEVSLAVNGVECGFSQAVNHLIL